MLPFTREQFLAVFAAYNEAVWPAQWAAYGLGALLVVAVLRPSPASGRVVAAGLAVMWAWTGVAYHALHFAAINRAALGFAALFVLQALGLLVLGVGRGRLVFGAARGPRAAIGWALVLYAALLYPVLGWLLGHRWPAMPSFGLTPCPLVIFTFGLLLLTAAPVPAALLVVPVLWSLIGGSAAFLLGVPQDGVLLAAGLSVLPLLRAGRRHTIAAGTG